jgi:hypothetical protein
MMHQVGGESVTLIPDGKSTPHKPLRQHGSGSSTRLSSLLAESAGKVIVNRNYVLQGLKSPAHFERLTARLKTLRKNPRSVRFASLRACLRQNGVVYFQQRSGTVETVP